MSTLPHIGPTVRTHRAIQRCVQAAERIEQESATNAERDLHQAIDRARHAPMFAAPEYVDPITRSRAWLWAALMAMVFAAGGIIAWVCSQPWRAM